MAVWGPSATVSGSLKCDDYASGAEHGRTKPRHAANQFSKRAAKNGEEFRIIPLQQDMKRFEFFSPARNEGYGKFYVQEVSSTGAILSEYKDTVGPNGLIERKWVKGKK